MDFGKNLIKLPKIGWLKTEVHRHFSGPVLSAALKCRWLCRKVKYSKTLMYKIEVFDFSIQIRIYPKD